MIRHRGDAEVALSTEIEVIEQETNPHAAVRSPQNSLAETTTAAVPLPDVVLHVDAVLGRVRQHDSCKEGIFARVEQAKARTALVASELVVEAATERRIAGLQWRDCVALRCIITDRSSSAARPEGDQGGPNGQRESPAGQRGRAFGDSNDLSHAYRSL